MPIPSPVEIALLALLALACVFSIATFVRTFRRNRDVEALDRTLRDELRASRGELADGQRASGEQVARAVGDSMRQVGAQLASVERGFGEMKALSEGVGDLRRLLSGVKERGTWGEVQLGALLADFLAPSQFEANVHVSRLRPRDVVEFAVRLPGAGEAGQVWLPVDSKFPRESYERLLSASREGDESATASARRELRGALLNMAKDIADKYIDPPATTPFAVLFLPTEGLFLEAVSMEGLGEKLQRNYRVMIAGPSTLAALLASLRVGFRTLAVQERAGEVWDTLSAAQKELGKYEDTLTKLRTQLLAMEKTLDEEATRARALSRALSRIGERPDA